MEQGIPAYSVETVSLEEAEVGELVLVCDEDHAKRGKWPLARITKVLPGRDNVVRTVEIKTRDGEYTRPVSSLYRLEDDHDDIRQGAECNG